MRITRLQEAKPNIKFDALKGRLRVAADFDAPLPAEVLAEFEGH